VITWTGFSRRVSRILQEAFSSPGTEPERVAAFLIRSLPRRPIIAKDRKDIEYFLQERGIKEIIHFTRIENVPNIMKYGLIPRKHLENTALKIVLNPYFTDSYRFEKNELANCLSFTTPNYRMFFRKRIKSKSDSCWAVLSITPEIILENYFECTTSNSASSTCKPSYGILQLRKLFSDVNLRKKLAVLPSEPTDPQAEILEDTVISPTRINKVYVKDQQALIWLQERGINALQKNTFFSPRHDYNMWKQKNIFTGKNDYGAVLKYEKPLR